MADARRTGHPPIPEGLLESLTEDPLATTGADRVATARQHARARAFDDAVIVREIASQLLLLSD